MATQTTNSIGHVCKLLQRTYTAVRGAAKSLGIEPVAVHDGVDQFSDEQVERIAEALREQRAGR